MLFKNLKLALRFCMSAMEKQIKVGRQQPFGGEGGHYLENRILGNFLNYNENY